MSNASDATKGVSNVERRSWDKELYEKKALERLERGDDFVDDEEQSRINSSKEEFQTAPEGAAGPTGSKRAYLKARESKIDLDSKLNKTQVVTSSTTGSGQGGYWCEVCKCILKDSIAYLDHINGKKHLRTLGFSMRVEKSSADAVREKLEQLKRKMNEKSKLSGTKKKSAVQEYEERLAEAAANEEKAKAEKKEEKEKAKEEAGEELDEETSAMAEMMGFGGFAGGKK
eukprot:CAMPEP_0171460558 /NCGR_PEP_ID=MMETSP0945-20130129/5378_1 /TAXON_ID=109269 /ORGANISM="Vaucheria litorea, Strain CCMP2940" /LENGTH=228 /DNA_ID=CAMNT_0011986769 /DNA_START=6 /DNA_END=692 /DNA_ORIENTATION=+